MTNEDIIAWSVAAVAVAFIVLCGYLIALLRAAQRSLGTAQSAMQEVKETVQDLQGEVGKLAASVNAAAEDVRGKLRSVDPLFDAVQDVGVVLGEVTGAAREAAKGLAMSARKQAASLSGDSPVPSWLRKTAFAARIATVVKEQWQGRKESTHSHVKEEI
ncbi:DUF948 domain-containing protein [Cohnella sp. GCM10027633]|uniref:DUF948 domain-containing protein n=1 Tax=unclassified Cohnella TaxID=2636738 RepID=UPI00362E4FAD